MGKSGKDQKLLTYKAFGLFFVVMCPVKFIIVRENDRRKIKELLCNAIQLSDFME